MSVEDVGEVCKFHKHQECKCNCVQLFQVGSHLQHSVCTEKRTHQEVLVGVASAVDW